MSKTVYINSQSQFASVLGSSRVVVTDFYADWCGPCKAIAPTYEQLSARLSRPQKVTFTKVNIDSQKGIASEYGISSVPTFIVFKNSKPVETVLGADPGKLNEVVKKLAAEAESDGKTGGFDENGLSGFTWFGGEMPKGYRNITEQVDLKGLDLLNADTAFGDARGLFHESKPSGLDRSGKSVAKEGDKKADWVESDTDQQLMLFMPFNSSLKVHTILLTSLPPTSGEELPMRPKTIHIYSNRAHVLGFEEAEGIAATQVVTLRPQDWDPKTGTARVELRFVKFQNATSLVLFVVDGDDDEGKNEADKVRLDRIRLIGEAGEKREMGKLEKSTDGAD